MSEFSKRFRRNSLLATGLATCLALGACTDSSPKTDQDVNNNQTQKVKLADRATVLRTARTEHGIYSTARDLAKKLTDDYIRGDARLEWKNGYDATISENIGKTVLVEAGIEYKGPINRRNFYEVNSVRVSEFPSKSVRAKYEAGYVVHSQPDSVSLDGTHWAAHHYEIGINDHADPTILHKTGSEQFLLAKVYKNSKDVPADNEYGWSLVTAQDAKVIDAAVHFVDQVAAG